MVLIARILLFVVIVIIVAVAGAFAAFFGLYYAGKLMGESDFEGALAMGAVGFAPIGGIAGAAIGGWIAWIAVRKLDGKTAMVAGYGLAVVVALAARWYWLDYY